MNRPPSRRLAHKVLILPLLGAPLVAAWATVHAAGPTPMPEQVFGIPNSEIFCMTHSAGGALLATGGDDGVIRDWDPKGRLKAILEGHLMRVAALAFSPDGTSLASASFDTTVRLWNPSIGRVRGVLKGHTDRVFAVAYSPNGRLLASGGFDGLTKLWDPATGRQYASLEHGDRVSGIAFSPDGQILTTCSHDGLVRVWKVSDLTSTPRR